MNVEHRSGRVKAGSMFGVRCWLFDAHRVENKNPTAGLGSGVFKSFVMRSEPDCRAAKQPVQKRQSKVQRRHDGSSDTPPRAGGQF
jgi:hypothetical protein